MTATPDAPDRPPITQWLTIDEACRRLRLSKRHVGDLLRDGEIAGAKYGGRWRVPPDAIDDYLDRAASRAWSATD